MNWDNLRHNKCPDCTNELMLGDRISKCSSCTFRIRTNKLEELKKPKEESASYKAAVARNKAINRRAKEAKKRRILAREIQNKERLDNLRRMLAKGLLSQEDYNKKILT